MRGCNLKISSPGLSLMTHTLFVTIERCKNTQVLIAEHYELEAHKCTQLQVMFVQFDARKYNCH